MSIGTIVTAMTADLTTLLYKSCQRKVPSLSTSDETWANSGSAFACMYEETAPAAQGTLDYDAGAGYGFDVWMAPTQTVNAGDRIVVDGITVKVLEAATVGAPGPLKRVRTQRLT
ncbi:MAG: hypothetical protein IT337_09370 [Thermomicrobiales bacterium]|nr:hypothetical protein [Thermomicrobiales bacterium]